MLTFFALLPCAQVSDRVIEVVEALESSRSSLFHAQSDKELVRMNDCLLVDLRLAGIVQAWASGAAWQQIMQARRSSVVASLQDDVLALVFCVLRPI